MRSGDHEHGQDRCRQLYLSGIKRGMTPDASLAHVRAVGCEYKPRGPNGQNRHRVGKKGSAEIVRSEPRRKPVSPAPASPSAAVPPPPAGNTSWWTWGQ